MFHSSVVIGGFLETVVSGKHEPKLVVLADDSEVCIRVISDDPIGCEAIGPICNRDELHRKLVFLHKVQPNLLKMQTAGNRG